MGKATGVDQDSIRMPHGFLDPIDELTLMVRLDRFDLDAQIFGEGRQIRVNVRQGLRTVDFRFAFPQQIQIGAVHDENS
jgi:hypothetical protein